MRWPWTPVDQEDKTPTPTVPAKPKPRAWSGEWSMASLKCPSCENSGEPTTVWSFEAHKGGPEEVRCTNLACRVESYKPLRRSGDEEFFVVNGRDGA